MCGRENARQRHESFGVGGRIGIGIDWRLLMGRR